jgi:hypothetical protein
MALRVFDGQVEMNRFVHVVEKRERGGKNEDMNGCETTQQKNQSAFFKFGKNSW